MSLAVMILRIKSMTNSIAVSHVVETACQPNDKGSKYFKHIAQDYSRSKRRVHTESCRAASK
jgi:hypothetical protein